MVGRAGTTESSTERTAPGSPCPAIIYDHGDANSTRAVRTQRRRELLCSMVNRERGGGERGLRGRKRFARAMKTGSRAPETRWTTTAALDQPLGSSQA